MTRQSNCQASKSVPTTQPQEHLYYSRKTELILSLGTVSLAVLKT